MRTIYIAALYDLDTATEFGVTGVRYFAILEHFAPDDGACGDTASRALAALDAVAAIGSDEEREETARLLMEAIAVDRHAEGRPF